MARFTLSYDCCSFELFPVSKKLARQYEKETGHESVLIQTDWDYPNLARSLGWSMRSVQGNKRKPCEHLSTDGTVKCPECGISASAFIEAASEYLHKHDGDSFNDPYDAIGSYFGW